MKIDSQVYCTECGNVIEMDVNVCPNCGHEQIGSKNNSGNSPNSTQTEIHHHKSGLESKNLAIILNKLNEGMGDIGRLISLYLNLTVVTIIIGVIGTWIAGSTRKVGVLALFGFVELIIVMVLIYQANSLSKKLRENEMANDARLLDLLQNSSKKSV